MGTPGCQVILLGRMHEVPKGVSGSETTTLDLQISPPPPHALATSYVMDSDTCSYPAPHMHQHIHPKEQHPRSPAQPYCASPSLPTAQACCPEEELTEATAYRASWSSPFLIPYASYLDPIVCTPCEAPARDSVVRQVKCIAEYAVHRKLP